MDLESCLAAVPESERESLRRRWEKAEREGWKHLGLWVYEFAAEESDLAGVPPGEKFVKFVPMDERCP